MFHKLLYPKFLSDLFCRLHRNKTIPSHSSQWKKRPKKKNVPRHFPRNVFISSEFQKTSELLHSLTVLLFTLSTAERWQSLSPSHLNNTNIEEVYSLSVHFFKKKINVCFFFFLVEPFTRFHLLAFILTEY